MTGRPTAPVAVLAPTGRDSAVAVRVLESAGFEALACRDMHAACDAIALGAGAVVLAEESLRPAARDQLMDTLGAQPAWSDIPLIVLTGEGELSGKPSATLRSMAERANLTLLERPVRTATFTTTLRAALRARSRQLELRDHLAQRHEHERKLQDARKQAEVASEAKTRFLATMSHELRTPLNAIAGYAEIMAMEVHGPITAQQRADLERIERSQRYLLSLINDILNFAKIEAGQVAFRIQPFPIGRLFRALEGFVAPQIAAKDVSFSIGSSVADCQVKADEEKVQQILLNLLSNAIKFTPLGGRITVSCESRGEMIAVMVGDTGPGVPENRREDVFEPFVQLDRGLTSTAQGTGLGLSISRDLARKMGGELSVTGAPGAGATFTLVLPAA